MLPTRPRSLTLFLLTIAVAGFLVPAVARAASRPVAYLTWYGQSCFLLESASGARIVMDPDPDQHRLSSRPADLHADAVTISHEHPDHTNVALVQGKPRVLRGLTADKKGWMRIDEKVKDISVRSVGVYHDTKRGARNAASTPSSSSRPAACALRISAISAIPSPTSRSPPSARSTWCLVPVGGGPGPSTRRKRRTWWTRSGRG